MNEEGREKEDEERTGPGRRAEDRRGDTLVVW